MMKLQTMPPARGEPLGRENAEETAGGTYP